MQQLEAITGLDFDLWPSVWEVMEANRIFRDFCKKNIYDLNQPIAPDSAETFLSRALSEVWRQGRIYQRDHQAD